MPLDVVSSPHAALLIAFAIIILPSIVRRKLVMRKLVAAIAMLLAFASGAEARAHHHHHNHLHHHHHYSHRHSAPAHSAFDSAFASTSTSAFAYAPAPASAPSAYGYGGRPAAWCGWYMRTQVGSDPGPQYNLARAWAHYGVNAGGPSIGTIVVWPHHVGEIVGQENGQWVVRSGNDGHAVRTRARSLAGVIAFRRASWS
jgi:hypothetical protein